MAKQKQPGSATQTDLDALHSALELGFEQVLGGPVTIREERTQIEDDAGGFITIPAWQQLYSPREFVVEMRPSGRIGHWQYGERQLSKSKQLCVQMGSETKWGNTPWVAWTEKWQVVEPEVCRLKSAWLLFFYGRSGDIKERQQLIRAEWDQVELFGGNAGQPHWHVDRKFVLDMFEPAAPKGDLIADENLIGVQEVDPSGLHLAMGGWRNAGKNVWQLSVAGKWSELAEWACATLSYTKDQFEHIGVDVVA